MFSCPASLERRMNAPREIFLSNWRTKMIFALVDTAEKITADSQWKATFGNQAAKSLVHLGCHKSKRTI